MRAFLGLGSNIGEREGWLTKAITALSGTSGITVVRKSSLYRTEPVGVKEQPEFLNMVLEVDTSSRPAELLRTVKSIEQQLGRTSSQRWGPREIDIDLLYYGDIVLNEPGLQIPHPEATKRRFVLVPLSEIAESFTDPLRKLSIAHLLKICPDTSGVRKLDPRRSRRAARTGTHRVS